MSSLKQDPFFQLWKFSKTDASGGMPGAWMADLEGWLDDSPRWWRRGDTKRREKWKKTLKDADQFGELRINHGLELADLRIKCEMSSWFPAFSSTIVIPFTILQEFKWYCAGIWIYSVEYTCIPTWMTFFECVLYGNTRHAYLAKDLVYWFTY